MAHFMIVLLIVPVTLATAGVVADDIITVAIPRSKQVNKSQQEMTLNIAQLKKRAGGDTQTAYLSPNTYNVNNLSLPSIVLIL